MEALGPRAAEDVARADRAAGLRQLRDGRLRRAYARRRRPPPTSTPVHLPVVGEIGAGQARLLALSPGTAAKIMTGAPVPAGCDAVVPYEWTDRGVAQVRITQAPEPGQHIRLAGEDVAEGDLLHRARHRPRARATSACSPPSAAPPSAAGPRPRVVVLSTGSELREPGTPLGHDSIYDGNSYLLAAAARRAGAIAYRVGIVPDDPRAFLDALSDQLVRADLVVTSGGVQRGRLRRRQGGARRRSARCGSAGSRCSPASRRASAWSARTRTPIFTLPGNPVSAYISFEMFVLPAHAPDDGQAALLAARSAGPGSPTASRSPAGTPAVSCAAACDARPRRRLRRPRSAATART